MMDHSTDNLEQISAREQMEEEKKVYTPRPKFHLFVAWLLIAVVLFAFFGMCYWMVMYGKV